jgi:serine/threonine protein kinase
VIYKLIKQGKYEYAPEQSWRGVSSVAKDFIDHLLVVDYRQRFTAKQALAHPWLSGHKADHHAHHLPHLATQLGSYIHLRKSDESNKPKLGGHLHFGHKHSHS